jgi:predicted acylesterase/phospholipase RssA
VALVGTTPRARSLVRPLLGALVQAGERPYLLTEGREVCSGSRIAALREHHDPVLLDVTPECSGWELPTLLAQAREVLWLVEVGACEPALGRLDALLRQAPELARCTHLVHVRRESDPLPSAGWPELNTAAPDFQVTQGETDGPPPRLQQRELSRLVHHLLRRRLALALGGGGMRGVAHVGLLRGLEKAGIFPDLISGTSIGSVVAAGYSRGYGPDAILDIFQKELASGPLLKRTPGGEALKTWSLFRFGGWKRILRRYLGDVALEQLPIPVYPVSVDLISGDCVVRDRGAAVDALLESINLPGIIRPITRDGLVLVDGGVLNNVPGDVARHRGGDLVVGVNLAPPSIPRSGAGGQTIPADPWQYPGLLNVLLRIMEVQQSEVMGRRTGAVDFMITPDLGDHGLFHYGRFQELARAGEAAAEEAVPALKALLANLASRPGTRRDSR